jgi:hypothetical protein
VKNYRRFVPVLVLMTMLFVGGAMAQSTIFNIPTTDTVAKGKVYAEFDFVPQMPKADTSRTYLYNPRAVVGVSSNVEIGVNFPVYHYGNDTPPSTTYAYIQPNVKWKFYDNTNSGVALAIGGIFNVPLNYTDSQDSFGLLYGLISKKFKGDYGPRFHAGIYGVVAKDPSPSFNDERTGAVIGYEQPIKKISIVADWFSGKNGIGYFTPGISIAVPKNGLFNVGYMIGNDSWKDSNATKNRYLMLYYGITF